MRERPAERGDDDTKATDESVASKQMATLIELMRHQMEWSMRSESGRREQDLGCAEALETRMRGIEVLKLPPPEKRGRATVAFTTRGLVYKLLIGGTLDRVGRGFVGKIDCIQSKEHRSFHIHR